MEDPERANAREWNLNLPDYVGGASTGGGWQEVVNKKGKKDEAKTQNQMHTQAQQQQNRFGPLQRNQHPESRTPLAQQPNGQANRGAKRTPPGQQPMQPCPQPRPQENGASRRWGRPPAQPSLNQQKPAPPKQQQAPSAPEEQPLIDIENGPAQKQPHSAITAQAKKLRRPQANIDASPNGKAQEAWRRHDPPARTIHIPDELALQDKSHIEIARQHGTFIFSEPKKPTGGYLTFGIWGDTTDVTATAADINAWIAEWRAPRTTQRAVQKFAKVVSLTPALRIRRENEWKREVKRERYRRYPPPGTKFGAIGTFYWPLKDYRPEEVLGNSYEALDSIRMDGECYVVFVQQQHNSVFQVMGSQKAVQESLIRIRKTCFQIAARQIATVRLYLLHWPNASSLPSHILLKPYHLPTIDSKAAVTDSEMGNMPRGEGAEDDDARIEKQTGLSHERVRSIMLRVLPKLHYYRGHIRMRVRFGSFLADQFMRPDDGVYSLEQYEDMIRESQFVGHVTKEIGSHEIELGARNTLCKTNDLLQASSGDASLADVKPVYTAVYTFADDAGDLCLTVSWEETQDEGSTSTAFEKVSQKWTHLERDEHSMLPIIDVALHDLSGFAWHFDVQAAQSMDYSRLPEKLVDFADGIKIDANEARKDIMDKLFVTHKPYVGHLKSIQQRISYRYFLRDIDYTCELGKFQDRFFASRRTLIDTLKVTAVTEPRWSLHVFQSDWDARFTTNERLPIGKRADWPDDVDSWFPENMTQDSGGESKGNGFAHLMDKLNALGRVMKGAKEEDLIGGMSVG